MLRRRRVRKLSKVLLRRLKLKLKAALTLINVVNAILVLGVCVLCLQQCSTQISEYLDYRTRIQVSHTFPGSTVWLLPGITLCNNNRVRLERLVEESPQFKSRIEQIIENDPSIVTESKRIDWLIAMKAAIDETLNMTALVDDSPLDRLMQISRANTIRDVNCAMIWGEKMNCENFKLVESYQSAYCQTVFFMGSIYEAIANGKAYDFNTSLIGGKRKITPFDSFEIADVLVDFEPMQQADYRRTVGGHVILHSTAHVGLLKDVAHPVRVGQKYEFMIQRTMTRRLPPPYKSKCMDYKQNAYKYYSDEAYPSLELDRTNCLRNCVLRSTIATCKCWPVEVPYYPGDPLINASGSYKPCDWAREGSHSEQSAALYIKCFKQFMPDCRGQCRASCRTEDYKIRVVSSSWPARERFLLANNEFERRELYRLKRCCAMISIKYLQFQEQRNIMYPNMTLAQLVSNLGGIVSALVGVSAITMYRYMTRRVFKCKVVNEHKRLPGLQEPKTMLAKRQRQVRHITYWRKLVRESRREAEISTRLHDSSS